MLDTIAVILIVFWLLGYVFSYTVGGFINILLVVAVVVVLIRIIQRSKTTVATLVVLISLCDLSCRRTLPIKSHLVSI